MRTTAFLSSKVLQTFYFWNFKYFAELRRRCNALTVDFLSAFVNVCIQVIAMPIKVSDGVQAGAIGFDGFAFGILENEGDVGCFPDVLAHACVDALNPEIESEFLVGFDVDGQGVG